MKRIFFILILTFFFLVSVQDEVFSQKSEAKKEVLAEDQESSQKRFNIQSFRNPFSSWIPKKEKPEEAELQERIPSPAEPQRPEKIVPPAFKIYGLIWNSDLPQAIVDNQVVRIGDIINEAKIINITKEGMTIEYRNQEFFIEAQLSVLGQQEEEDSKKR